MSRYAFLNQYAQENRHYSIDDEISKVDADKNPKEAKGLYYAMSHNMTAKHLERLYNMNHEYTSFGMNDMENLQYELIRNKHFPTEIVNKHFRGMPNVLQNMATMHHTLSDENVEHTVKVLESPDTVSSYKGMLSRRLLGAQPVSPAQIERIKKADPIIASKSGFLLTHNNNLSKESIVHAWKTHMSDSYVHTTLPDTLHLKHKLTDSDREELRSMMHNDQKSLYETKQLEMSFNRPDHQSDVKTVSTVVSNLYGTDARRSGTSKVMHTHDVRKTNFSMVDTIDLLKTHGYTTSFLSGSLAKLRNTKTGGEVFLHHHMANDKPGFLDIRSDVPDHLRSIVR